ncbi:hypothetical protein LAUMK4_05682 [Mycobacterium persicum]|uniref:Transcriptional regulator n=1 Tax=Mycobacterium persicum TaxID=1487726 RepID=A0ABY6RSK8_9MYCO|nr:hypothetical protein [Mycobacterium persicum]VBA32114.1 hypothetical protein LAUMK4_05682 [Mycobacterium persicum]
MPNISEATRILRNDVLAQLRIAQRPLTTAQLRHHAPNVPVAGTFASCAPIREQIYRVLCALERQGLVTRSAGHGRELAWKAAASAADPEIASLEAALAASTPNHARGSELSRTTEYLIAGARRTHRIATSGDKATAAAALSQALVHCAVLLGCSRGYDRDHS